MPITLVVKYSLRALAINPLLWSVWPSILYCGLSKQTGTPSPIQCRMPHSPSTKQTSYMYRICSSVLQPHNPTFINMSGASCHHYPFIIVWLLNRGSLIRWEKVFVVVVKSIYGSVWLASSNTVTVSRSQNGFIAWTPWLWAELSLTPAIFRDRSPFLSSSICQCKKIFQLQAIMRWN